jgi:hypothetical protein
LSLGRPAGGSHTDGAHRDRPEGREEKVAPHQIVLESKPGHGTCVSLVFPSDVIEPEPFAKVA